MKLTIPQHQLESLLTATSYAELKTLLSETELQQLENAMLESLRAFDARSNTVCLIESFDIAMLALDAESLLMTFLGGSLLLSSITLGASLVAGAVLFGVAFYYFKQHDSEQHQARQEQLTLALLQARAAQVLLDQIKPAMSSQQTTQSTKVLASSPQQRQLTANKVKNTTQSFLRAGIATGTIVVACSWVVPSMLMMMGVVSVGAALTNPIGWAAIGCVGAVSAAVLAYHLYQRRQTKDRCQQALQTLKAQKLENMQQYRLFKTRRPVNDTVANPQLVNGH